MKYKIIVDKQSRLNPSTEKKEYEIEIEELRTNGKISDSLIITPSESYVLRKLSLSEFQVLNVLDEPIKEVVENLNIELFEGNNYIYLIDVEGNKFYAEYLINNDFTNTYVTTNEMTSAINQSSQVIELKVNQKLTDYATTEEMNSAIKISADEINSEVSKKVGENEIISKINQTAEEIKISAEKIDIDGKAIHFKTETSKNFGKFTESDKERVKKIILNEITPTSEDYNKYDINGDKKITPADYVIINKAILENKEIIVSGSYEINPYDAMNFIKIIGNHNLSSDQNSNQVNLSVGGSYLKRISTQGVSIYNNEKETEISSTGLYHYVDSESKKGFNLGEISVNDIDTVFLKLMHENNYINIQPYNLNGDGEIGIYSSDWNLKTIITNNKIETPTVNQTSLESIKKNFEKVENATSIVKNADIYKYNFKTEEDTDKKHYGFVIGKNYNTPNEVISKTGDSIDTYSMISILWKAVQEQQVQIEALNKEIKEIKENGKN